MEDNKMDKIEDNEIIETEEETKETKKDGKWSIVKEILVYALIFVLVGIVSPRYVWGKTIVDGISMNETLEDGDWLLNGKLSYTFGNPKRFDVVVFHSPMVEDENWVKRVIGLPGETVQIINGELYIDGERLEEDHYGNAKIDYSGVASEGFVVPEGTYFVMGDNRIGDNSWDSRYEEIGTIDKSEIWGKVLFRIRPLSRIGVIK